MNLLPIEILILKAILEVMLLLLLFIYLKRYDIFLGVGSRTCFFNNKLLPNKISNLIMFFIKKEIESSGLTL